MGCHAAGPEAAGLVQGDRTGESRTSGRAALRKYNLVAQSAVVAQGTTLRPRLRNGNGLPVYLCDMGSMYLEIAIGTALDDATTKLGLLVGIVEIDDGERVRSPEHGPPLPPGHRKMRACWREATSILGTNRQKTRAKEIGRAVRKGPRWPAMLS